MFPWDVIWSHRISVAAGMRVSHKLYHVALAASITMCVVAAVALPILAVWFATGGHRIPQ